MKALVVGPIRRTWYHVANGSQHHEEEVHGKARPYQHARFLVAPHFAYAVVDDIRHREYNQPPVKLIEPNAICFVSNTFAAIKQTQKSMLKSMNSTLTLLSLLFIILVFKEVYQALYSFFRLQRYNFFSRSVCLFAGFY